MADILPCGPAEICDPQLVGAIRFTIKGMSKSAIAPSSPIIPRPAKLAGLAIAIGGAVLFSTKAIVAKLMNRYNIDAITVIAFRM